MTHQITMRDRLLMLHTGAWVIVGLVILGIAGMFAIEIIGGIDPMRSHGRGLGWECDASRGGAVTCAQDLRLPAQTALAEPAECNVTQATTPTYVITVTCKVDCHHMPRLPTVAELINAGVDANAAPGVVKI
jgi:hypothetical protein